MKQTKRFDVGIKCNIHTKIHQLAKILAEIDGDGEINTSIDAIYWGTKSQQLIFQSCFNHKTVPIKRNVTADKLITICEKLSALDAIIVTKPHEKEKYNKNIKCGTYEWMKDSIERMFTL